MKLVASALPNVSWTPVVIVAVKAVFTARAFMGVKVATRPVESREGVPGTFAPLESAKVNVAVVIVRGFIALLNVAVMIVVLGQATVVPLAGVTAVTVGGARGLPVPACLSESLHPAMTRASRNAGIQILETFNVLIRFFLSMHVEGAQYFWRPVQRKMALRDLLVGGAKNPTRWSRDMYIN